MRLHVQRVREGQVDIAGNTVASIKQGLLVLVGFGVEDTLELPQSRVWNVLLEKLITLRIFPDDQGKMNLSLEDCGGELLLVSQFTLYGDTRKGRRPSFHLAAPPAIAETLFQRLVSDCTQRLPHRVQQGVFGADMDVTLTNWGPVTLLLDSDQL